MADLPLHYTSTGTEMPVSKTKTPQIPAVSHMVILNSGSSDSALQSNDLTTIGIGSCHPLQLHGPHHHRLSAILISLADSLNQKLQSDIHHCSFWSSPEADLLPIAIFL